MSASNPHTPAPQEPDDPPDQHQEPTLDARLLLPAAAGWITAILLMPQAGIVAVITAATATALTLTLLTLALRRRSRLLFTLVAITALSAGMAAASALQIHRLSTGPVPALAASNSTAKLHLKITSDPAVRSTPGNRRPPYVVLKATAEEVTAQGTTTRIRTPILLIGAPAWQHVRLGQHVTTTARLSPVDPGSDVAAMLSARSTPTVLDDPAWWLRAAEKVRAGLRASVEDQPDDVRGLVPALVMGDESALPPDLVNDFQLTGLTHLSAVSGESVIPVDQVLVQVSTIGNTAGQTLFCYPSVGATFALPNTHLSAQRWCLGSALLGESAGITWAWSGSVPALFRIGPSASVTGVSPLLGGLSGE
ncbi:hypothetical protein [Kribbella sp. DT2]|uniref:hypothetical protein n=1 Tax=Kribbella sp. DT2 TaxID=3393427 RepID=UPI003CFA5115